VLEVWASLKLTHLALTGLVEDAAWLVPETSSGKPQSRAAAATNAILNLLPVSIALVSSRIINK
jgi:hypothetical protein